MVIASSHILQKKKAPKRRKITFGSVTIAADAPPSKAEVKKTVAQGKAAITRLFERLQMPGIPDFEYQKDVPYFHADPNHPSRLIRRLNEKEESGVFDIKKNEFVVCE